MVSYLCEVAGVSRSGYYSYFSEGSKSNRIKREDTDEIVRNNILKAMKYKGKSKGARQIKMVLERKYGINYNLKRIRRVMKKYGIKCKIRIQNPYKKMMKATKEHTTLPNILKRNFKQEIPGKVLLTDITYLPYGSSKTGYLSTILDAATNEVVAYNVTDNLRMPLVLDTLKKLKRNKRIKLHPKVLIHSDQGSHYTSPKFQTAVKKIKDLEQSMSRRGNCWDNAPQESFFGHFKDDLDLSECKNIQDVIREVKSTITYHNNYRYQWGLKKMTPVEYRNHLLAVI